MAQQWVIQEKSADETEECWDTYVVGIVEEGMFLEQLRTHDKKMAIRIKCVMEWFETFEDGIIIPPSKINKKTAALQNPTRKRTRTT